MWTLIWSPERWVRMSFQEFVLEVSLARKCIDPANSVAANYGYVYSLENITAGWLSAILCEISPLLSSWAFLSPLDVRYHFLLWPNILLSMVVQQWVAVLEFSQEKMSAHPCTPPLYTTYQITVSSLSRMEGNGREGMRVLARDFASPLSSSLL